MREFWDWREDRVRRGSGAIIWFTKQSKVVRLYCLPVKRVNFIGRLPFAKGTLVLYSVFGDESYDEERKRVFAVAGLFGHEQDWCALNHSWSARTGGKEFHATDCEKQKNFKLCADLTNILALSKVMGFGIAMSLEDYSRIFEEPAKEMPYYFCFIGVVEHLAWLTRMCLPQEPVEFTFHQNCKVQYNAAFLYNYLIDLPEWEGKEFISDKLSFSSQKNPSIQAADLWTREVMKHMDNLLVQEGRPMRLSLQALRRTNRFGFDMHDKSYFEDMKQKLALRYQSGHSMREYHQWRESQNAQDTTENRLRYHMYLNLMEIRQVK